MQYNSEKLMNDHNAFCKELVPNQLNPMLNI